MAHLVIKDLRLVWMGKKIATDGVRMDHGSYAKFSNVVDCREFGSQHLAPTVGRVLHVGVHDSLDLWLEQSITKSNAPVACTHIEQTSILSA